MICDVTRPVPNRLFLRPIIETLQAQGMPDYDALVQRLFTQDANVRNVKAFFSVKRAKFDPRLDLAALAALPRSR